MSSSLSRWTSSREATFSPRSLVNVVRRCSNSWLKNSSSCFEAEFSLKSHVRVVSLCSNSWLSRSNSSREAVLWSRSLVNATSRSSKLRCNRPDSSDAVVGLEPFASVANLFSKTWLSRSNSSWLACISVDMRSCREICSSTCCKISEVWFTRAARSNSMAWTNSMHRCSLCSATFASSLAKVSLRWPTSAAAKLCPSMADLSSDISRSTCFLWASENNSSSSLCRALIPARCVEHAASMCDMRLAPSAVASENFCAATSVTASVNFSSSSFTTPPTCSHNDTRMS
mmetsp:Transcript_114864/g.324638  ORF Transcript_114864/g.324638 Transcript_114864/m.324638 type:complete len:286 (-) Transcript_114864:692-1549(-)